MLVSRKIGVLITKQILKIPYTYLIFQLGQKNPRPGGYMSFFNKKKWAFHTKYMAKIRISKFSPKNDFCPADILIEDSPPPTSHVSSVTCHMSCRWRVYYQWGLPCLVSTYLYYLLFFVCYIKNSTPIF